LRRLSAQSKIRAAPAVYPNASLVVTPGRALRTRRTTALIQQRHAPASVGVAIMPPSIIRGTSDCAAAYRRTVIPTTLTAAANREIRAAPAVHPNAALIVAPAIALCAGRTTALIQQRHAAARIGIAVVPPSIVRGAGDCAAARTIVPTGPATPNREVGPAPAVHPNAALIVAPAIALRAGRPAALIQQRHAAARIGIAIVPPSIVRGAGDCAATWAVIPTGPAASNYKIRTASAIYPNPSAIIAPGRALRAGGTAALPDHLYAAARVDGTVVPAAVV